MIKTSEFQDFCKRYVWRAEEGLVRNVSLRLVEFDEYENRGGKLKTFCFETSYNKTPLITEHHSFTILFHFIDIDGEVEPLCCQVSLSPRGGYPDTVLETIDVEGFKYGCSGLGVIMRDPYNVPYPAYLHFMDMSIMVFTFLRNTFGENK